MFKIQQGIVPNPGIKFGQPSRGIKAEVPLYNRSPSYVKTLRYKSFNYIGPKLFNLLPDDLSKFCPEQDTSNIVGSFKKQLDKFLAKFPDQPTIQGHARAANSNSLLDQRYYMNLS